MRRLIRLLVSILFALSLTGAALCLARIAADPSLRAIRMSTTQEITALTDRMMAQRATVARLTDLIETRLAETPRNWIALDALTALVIERAIDLPPELSQRLIDRRTDDFSLLVQAADCVICAYDAGACSLTQVFICQAPVVLSPVGDLFGVARAGTAYALGDEVDQVDLALSFVGLGASAVVLVSSGTSVTVKAGAAMAKTARAMGRLTPELLDMARLAVRTGVDWAGLPAVRSIQDLSAVVRADAFLPLGQTLIDLDRIRAATDATTTLHLLPMVASATDARRLANLSEALGPKLVARAEVLGKARLLRAAIRLSTIGWLVLSALAGVALSLAMAAGSVGQRFALRRFRSI